MSVRACSASTAARTSASQPSIEKSPSDGPGPAEREREPGPTRLARDAVAQRLIGVPDRGRAARAARKARQHEQTGHPRHARRAREMRPQAQSFRDELFHVGGYPGSRDRLDHEPGHFRVDDPALKEWAADRARAARGRADRRRAQGRAARGRPAFRRRDTGGAGSHRRPSTRRPELLKPAYAHWVDLADASPVGQPSRCTAGPTSSTSRPITEPEHVDALDSQAHLGARLRGVAIHVEVARPALGARPARAPARRARSPSRGTTRTAAARRGSTTTACPTTRLARRPSPCSPTSRSRRSTRASARRCPRSAGRRAALIG